MSESSVTACPSCGAKNRVPTSATGTPRCAKCRTPLPWVVDADDATFDDAAVRAKLPTLVDLWAPWCGPCRVVSPLVEQLGADLAGRLKVVKVNVDASPRTAARFAVQGIPTLLLLENGEVRGRQVGALPGPALRSWAEGLIANRS